MDTLHPSDNRMLQDAWKAHKEGRLEHAGKIYKMMVEKYPGFKPALNALGTVLLDMGRVEQAEKYFQRACDSDPPYVPALYNLARMRQVSGRSDEAERLYETIIQNQPGFGPAWNNLGLILRDAGRLSEAAAAMKKASQLMPDYAEGLNNLGVILEALERFPEAETALLKAVRLQPEYLSARFNLACLYHRLERFGEAEKELKRVLDRKPDDPGALYLLQTLGRLPAPERAPSEYVSRTFDDCAVNFEKKLAVLEYRTPHMLFSMVRPFLRREMAVLDLGCGTGLGADYYRDYAAILYGMDCSEKMLQIAKDKGIYDRLLKQDLLSAWKTDRVFDCIYSSDCLVYFGNLSPVFSRVSKHLAPGGIFAFSVEKLLEDERVANFILRRCGRFAHAETYVKSCLEEAGLSVLDKKPCQLRKEAGRPVEGLLMAARLQE